MVDETKGSYAVQTSEEKLEELWEDLAVHLDKGIPDVQTLQRVYNILTKFMTRCMVALSNIQEDIDGFLDENADEYFKKTRGLVLQNLHYNERRMMQHLSLPREKRRLVTYRDGLVQRFEQCKDIQRILRDRLEAFKLEYQLSGGSYETKL